MIVMLSAGFPPEIYGGAEQQCLRLSSALAAAGRRIVIVASCRSAALPRFDTVDGVQIVRIATRFPPDHGGTHAISTIKWTLAVFWWLWRHRHDIELMHVHQGKLHLLPALLAERLLGLPFIVKVGSSDEDFDYARLNAKSGGYGRLVLRQVIKRCRLNIAISSRIAEQMRDAGVPPARVLRIPNGIDIERFQFIQEKSLGRRRIFLFLGRLEDEKQPIMLARSFSRACNSSSGHRLIIAGDGSLMDEVAEYIRRNDLGGRIQAVGRISDVRPLFAQAHFLVLPSLIEGLSNALLEAMSSGLVPIASAVSGSTDVIRDGENGFLFERSDETALVNCLNEATRMSEPEWRAMRDAARRTIEDGYVMADIARTYGALYEKLVRTPGGERHARDHAPRDAP
jgi:glycosyltransferase involved in cell wall biosynthesis